MRPVTLVFALASLAGCSFDATGNGSDGTPSQADSSTSSPASSSGDGPLPTSSGEASTSTSASTMGSMSMAADPTTTEPVDPETSASSEATGDTGDTGNMEGSSSGPPPPGCGNGVVEADEQCDDGNTVDTDGCTAVCKPAVCGDGIVQANVEACDDGNANEADGCTSMCVAPTCDDGATNGSETDVDCGGSCKKCALKQQCSTGNDCETGVCADICVYAPQCAALKSLGKPSGTYTIDPDGDGGEEPFAVWCEQGVAGGGWTMVLKIDGSKNSFVYADAKWTDPMAWMPDADLDRTETKLRSFGTVQASEVLVGMEAPLGQGPLMLKYIQFNLMNDPPSLASVFMAGTHLGTTNAYAEWTGLVPVGSLQTNCKRQGFNAQADNNQQANTRVRIGILGNNENDCGSPNSFIGVGASPEGDYCDGGYKTTTGNGAVCGADKGKQDVAGFAVVFVR